MSKFNTQNTQPARGTSPIKTEQTPSLTTHEGGTGYARDTKSELFLLAVSNFVSEDTFYEKAGDRDARFRHLVREAAAIDPDWTAGFLYWLRTEANMRSASLVGAAEYAWARRDEAGTGRIGMTYPAPTVTSRQVIASVLQRADEPGEMLAYWTSKYGRAIPKPVKRGVADAVRRLYNEYTLLKYDTASKGFRFGDVIDLTHPTPDTPAQGILFKYALDRRHGRAEERPEQLPMVRANAVLRHAVAGGEVVDTLLFSDGLKRAGMTWEDALSLAGDKVYKAKLWEAMIPSMGYMAALRNLRNFDEAGVSDPVAAELAARLADPAQVARSRQFPFRFLSAYEAVPSLRWGHALEQALQHSLVNLPAMPGHTLILVDTSGSMTYGAFSKRSTMSPMMAAAVFGVALAAKGEQVDLYGFADGTRPFQHDVPKGASVLKEVAKFMHRSGEDGHGTNIGGALTKTFKGHDRVFVISDMQTMDGGNTRDYERRAGLTDVVPQNVPIYGFNLGGYQAAAMPSSSTRVEFGGLTDATFRMIPLIEAGRNANWPWEQR